ncbi:MAG: ribosome recycling factor [Proteobacteria bacterium]|nr:ribosome recycling factor [Pseudomonadota bacterium]
MADADDVSLVLDSAREAMERSVASLRRDLQKVRTGRASTALLDGIMVDYYGTPTPLHQLANLSTPDPRLITVNPFDKGSIQAIERAIQTSDLGLTPQNDGKLVRIGIPPLTEERRKELVKHCYKAAEGHRVGVREGRRDAVAMLKDLEKEGLPRDDRTRGEKQIQELTDEHVKKIDEMTAQKEKEVLEV